MGDSKLFLYLRGVGWNIKPIIIGRGRGKKLLERIFFQYWYIIWKKKTVGDALRSGEVVSLSSDDRKEEIFLCSLLRFEEFIKKLNWFKFNQVYREEY